MSVKYNLPRFITEEAVEEMSADNLKWLNDAGRWIKFYPAASGGYDDAIFINLDHLCNKGKSLYQVADECRRNNV